MNYFIFLAVAISPAITFTIFNEIENEGLGEVSASDMSYYFYSLKNPEIPVEVTANNTDAMKQTHFNASKETLILVHGWGDTANGFFVKAVQKALVAGNHDLNLIGLDWSPVWRNTSNHEAWEIKSRKTGKFIADFLEVLAKDYGLKYSKLTITGLSAGGPVAAGIGYALQGAVKAILALDTENVTKSDAKYVQYVHTSYVSGTEAWGNIDFFPNGGLNQTDCDGLLCNHARSASYYIESLNSNKFVGRKCDTYENFKAGKCNDNPTAVLGGLEFDTKRPSGKYFLTTNGKPPFAKG